MFISVAAFLVAILFVGLFNANAVLYEKPFIISWSGFRVTHTHALMFWLREAFLEITGSPHAILQSIPEFQFNHGAESAF
jgi:hypothetical protein